MEALGDGVVLIRGAEDFHFAFCVACQPYPSATELADTGGVEFFLEGFEVAESLLDYIGDGAGRIASTLGLHDVPKHGVVDVASSVVADGAAAVLCTSVQVAKQIFRSFLKDLVMVLVDGVQVLDVCVVSHW